MQVSRFPPGQLLFGSRVVVGSVGPSVGPAVGASVGGAVGGAVVAPAQVGVKFCLQ